MFGKKTPKIKYIDTTDIPVCPNCGKLLDKIKINERGFIEKSRVYMCGYCNTLLSIGTSAWMP